MKFLILKTKDPYLNLAIEEYLFENSSDEMFILWQNEPTVVIGKNQNAYAEVNLDFVRSRGIHIARRITGGGAVYHDLGNVNYSYISSGGCEGIDFKTFTEPIIEFLCKMSLDATLSGRNDIVIGDKKVSGNAQYARGGRVLHHGTLLFDSELDVLTSALKVDPEKITAKAIKSTRSRVTNIREMLPFSLSCGEFIARLADFIKIRCGAEEIEPPLCDEIYALRARNASDDYIFPTRDYLAGYSIIKRKRFDFGSVEVRLDMNGDVIKCAKIYGDFFGNAPIAELEKTLSGLKLSDIRELENTLDIHKFIHGMSFNVFCDLIKN